MPKLTLLELVQDILSDLNSDNVNSITDTVEAQQVAQTIKSVYFDIIADKNIPEHEGLKQLTSLGDSTKPNYMLIPTNVKRVKWLKYDVRTTTDTNIQYTTIDYKTPSDFLQDILGNDSSADNVDTVVDFSNVSLLIRNDKFPQFFTSFDDEYLVFDSYNSTEESTLTASRTLALVTLEPTWTASDTFVPDLDSDLFPLLLAEAKSLAFINNTQASNPKIEQIAKRHQNNLQNKRHRIKAANTKSTPDFGRKR